MRKHLCCPGLRLLRAKLCMHVRMSHSTLGLLLVWGVLRVEGQQLGG
jgi:hypothetical protein